MRTMLTSLLLVFCIVAVYAQSERSYVRDGNGSYKDKKYSDAEVNYKKALDKNNSSLEGTFNLGDALYKQDRFDEAAQEYQLAATKASNNDVKSAALHNLGNTLVRNKKYQESLAAYKEALKLNPKDVDTKYNYEYAKRMLQQQQQQQQQQKQDDKKQNDKQKQDQQKQQQEQQKQEQQKQDQQKQQQQQQQQQAQQKKQQISKADAERILEALKNDEKKVQKKLQKKVPAQVKTDKDW